MSSQYLHTAYVIGSTRRDRLWQHLAPANHYSDTLQAGVKSPFCYTTTHTSRLSLAHPTRRKSSFQAEIRYTRIIVRWRISGVKQSADSLYCP